MYSCDQEHTSTRAAFSTSYQPRIAARSLHHSAQPGQVPAAVGSAAVQPRRVKKRHVARPSMSSSSSTTVVATDVSNFRAMVQELTGFPPAAIFRPLPLRPTPPTPWPPCMGVVVVVDLVVRYMNTVHQAQQLQPATLAPDVPAVQPLMQQPPGVFDGLSDLGSPELDSWTDLSFE